MPLPDAAFERERLPAQSPQPVKAGRDASAPGRPSAPGTQFARQGRSVPEEFIWDNARLERAGALSRRRFGQRVAFYLPGMFVRNGVCGQYPALSVTGVRCAQGCAHCGGQLLKSMPDVSAPQKLLERCRQLAAQGVRGVLLSGGCDGQGRVPWKALIPTIARVKAETGLFVSVHCGLLEAATALDLKRAGADQALVDIIGSAATYAQVYHLADGPERLRRTLEALDAADLPVVPHIVAGLHFGRLLGEGKALELLAQRPPALLVVVACMRLPGTDMAQARAITAEDVCGVLIRARELLPETEISLGCARPRNADALEALALRAGVSRMALPSAETVDLARALGLEPTFYKTCCSVRLGAGAADW